MLRTRSKILLNSGNSACSGIDLDVVSVADNLNGVEYFLHWLQITQRCAFKTVISACQRGLLTLVILAITAFCLSLTV